ncbi:MAG: GGDEF domain-containing protein [Fibrobacterales bacterium]
MVYQRIFKGLLETTIAPVIFLVMVLVLNTYLAGLLITPPEILFLLPYVILGVTGIITLRFNKNNALFIIVTIAFCYWCLGQTFLVPHSISHTAILLVTATLIPLNYFIFSASKNRVLMSSSGLIKALLLALELFILYSLTHRNSGIARNFFGMDIWSSTKGAYEGLPDLAVILLALALVVGIAKWLYKHSHIEGSIVGSLIILMATYSSAQHDLQFLIGYMGAALTLLIGILQTSYNMAYRDELTNIPGRRALNEYLLSLGRNYSIAMVDIDHFKKFNDDYGHDVGDQVLQLVASKVRQVTGGGQAFRYGGEEFAVVFNRTSIKKAVPHIEDLRQSVSEYQMSIRSRLRPKRNSKGKQHRSTFKIARIVQITVSMGVAERSDQLITTDEVIKAADRALYKAKNKGRNQVCF